MYRHQVRRRPLKALLGIVGVAALVTNAQAGGFALIEHGASGLGNAYAGAAAVSADTSTVWFNPAGITEIEGRELAAALHVISADTTFTDQGTTLGARLGGSIASGPDTASPGGATVVPNFYYVAPINQQWSYGLSIGVPFGSSTEYDDNWKGRYTTIRSGINVIDINPAVSYRVSDKVRLGFGISLQRLSAELSSAVDSGAACLGLAASADTSFNSADCFNAGLLPGDVDNDGFGEVTGDSTAFSFNLGALFVPREDVKIGVAYRHTASHELEGDADFTVNEALQTVLDSNTNPASQPLTQGFLNNTTATAEVDLPATFSVSAAWEMNKKLQFLGDITWTGWSSFEELRVVFDNPAQPQTLAVQDWEDVFRYSAGLNYAYSTALTLRTGIAFDEEAIPSPQRRTARIPGNDRTWFSLGAGFAVSESLSLDLGYAHLFLDETPIDNSDPESGGTGQVVRGLYDSSVDIVSAQINWAFH